MRNNGEQDMDVIEVSNLNRQGESQVLHLDLGRAPYVLYGVKYIGLVSLALFWHVIPKNLHHASHVGYGVKLY